VIRCGLAGDAEDDQILAAQRTLARVEGVWAGPTGAASLAVLMRLLAERALDPGQDICVIVSETGLKTEAEPPSRRATAFDEASLRRLVRERLGAG
jgi:threonine synthase